MNQSTKTTDLCYLHGQEHLNGTNINEKQDTIFLGQEMFYFFMAPKGKTHMCPGTEESSPLTWSEYGEVSSVKNTTSCAFN